MGKAIVVISRNCQTLSFPDDTIIEGIRVLFDTDTIEVKVEHPDLPKEHPSVPLQRRVVVQRSDGQRYFD